MKSIIRTGSSAVLAALLTAGAMQASAETSNDVYGYAGASIGDAKVKSSETAFSAWETSWKVFGGYMFNENIGAEVTYADYGSADDNGVDVDELTSFSTQVIGVLPLGNFDLFAKIGMAYYDAEFIFDNGATPTRNGVELASGFGARYNWGKLAIRAEAEAIDVEYGDLYNLSIGAQYRF